MYLRVNLVLPVTRYNEVQRIVLKPRLPITYVNTKNIYVINYFSGYLCRNESLDKSN